VAISTNHDLILIAQEVHKIRPDSVLIGQQVYGLVYDFLNHYVNLFDLLGVGLLLNTFICLFKNEILKFK